MTLSATTDDRPRHAEGAPRKRGPEAPAATRLRGWLASSWFLAPALLLFFFFVLIPIVVAFYTSFFRWGGFGFPDDFVGLENYRQLAGDEVFLGDLWRGFLLVVLSLAVQLPLALGDRRAAEPADARPRGRTGRSSSRPYILSEVIAGVLFGIIFLPGDGLADTLVKDLPLLGDLAGKWFSDPSTVMPTLIAVMTLEVLRLPHDHDLAGLQGIPDEVLEAAPSTGRGPGGGSARHAAAARRRPSGSACSCPSSARSSCSTWCGSSRRAGPTTRPRRWPITMFQFGFKRYQMGYAGAISVVDVPDQHGLLPAVPALTRSAATCRAVTSAEADDDPAGDGPEHVAAHAGVGARLVHRRPAAVRGDLPASRPPRAVADNPSGCPHEWKISNYTGILGDGHVLAADRQQRADRGRTT